MSLLGICHITWKFTTVSMSQEVRPYVPNIQTEGKDKSHIWWKLHSTAWQSYYPVPRYEVRCESSKKRNDLWPRVEESKTVKLKRYSVSHQVCAYTVFCLFQKGERQKERRLAEVTGLSPEAEIKGQPISVERSIPPNDELVGVSEALNLPSCNSDVIPNELPNNIGIQSDITSDLWTGNVEYWTPSSSQAENINSVSSSSVNARNHVVGNIENSYNSTGQWLPESFDTSYFPASPLMTLSDLSSKAAYMKSNFTDGKASPNSRDQASEVSLFSNLKSSLNSSTEFPLTSKLQINTKSKSTCFDREEISSKGAYQSWWVLFPKFCIAHCWFSNVSGANENVLWKQD